MAAAIDQARSSFSKMFNGGRYSRFSLQPEQNGGSQVVEVKLSNDLEDDHAPSASTDESHASPSYRPHPRGNYRNVCYLALGTLLIFIIGYLVGYVSHRSPKQVPVICQPDAGVTGATERIPDEGAAKDEGGAGAEDAADVSLDWSDIKKLLAQRLTMDTFNKGLGDFELSSHEAGSDGDRLLGNRVFDIFKSLEMNPWSDTHYVQLPRQDSEKPNCVLIGSEEVGRPKGFLAYSSTGSVQGRVVYGNYGRPEDLTALQNQNVELEDAVVLLRAGRISYSQQVANAAQLGASAVLIYPDPQEHAFQDTTELYGHVHLGTGDPYTPGFPSFNHTQFPPTKSSGLPSILAQTITAQTANKIFMKMGGAEAPSNFKGGLKGVTYRLGGASGSENVTVEVNNVLVSTEIHNVFGVIEGLVDSDRYVVLGAQRDARGPGYAKSTVGTVLLMELARAVFEMVEKDGFRPRRSLVFASWSAGEYGSVGATEWLEGYLSSIDKKALTYISLDGVVTGHGTFKASASPLLHSLLERTMKEVSNPIGFGLSGKNLYDQAAQGDMRNVLSPMTLEDPAYPFLAFSGIPSISFSFKSEEEEYPYYGTSLDNKDHLGTATAHRISTLAIGAGQLAGQMALRLVHDHLVKLDVSGYKVVLSQSVRLVNIHLWQLSQAGSSKRLTARWLSMALGSFSRAAADLDTAIQNTDLSDHEACRLLNDRIMGVEHGLLSPYVSPIETPFRHLLWGRGNHTLASLVDVSSDGDQLHTQLALATWTLQSTANNLAKNVWDLDNQI